MAITAQMLKCTLGLLLPVGFNERHVVENKDRFLEASSLMSGKTICKEEGIEKQRRELYREDQRILGCFLEQSEESHLTLLPTKPLIEKQNTMTPNPSSSRSATLVHPPYGPTPSYLKLYDDVDIHRPSFTRGPRQPNALKALRQHNVDIDHDSIVHQLNPSEESR